MRRPKNSQIRGRTGKAPTTRRPARRTRRRPRGPARTGARGRIGAYRGQAQQRLRRFRQGSVLAVAVTAWLLLLVGAPTAVGQGEVEQATEERAPAPDVDL